MSTQLPQDKTPAQRARIKLYEQFAVVFLINAALAAYVLISSQSSNSRPDWLVVIVAAIAQGVLALFNVLEKYFSANSQPLYSAMFAAARAEVVSKAPPAPYSTTDQALQQAVNAAFQPSYTVPSSLKPVQLQPIPTVPNTPPAGAVPLTTVPAMPVVQAQ